MHIRFPGDAREIEAEMVVETRQRKARAAPIRIHHACHPLAFRETRRIPRKPRRGILGNVRRTWQEQHAERFDGMLELPDLATARDLVEFFPQRPQVADQVAADPFHHLPHRLAGTDLGHAREAPKQREIHRRVQLREKLALHTEPRRRLHRAAGVEPFRHLQPVAILPGVLVKPQIHQHQAQRARRRMILGKLVVIEVPAPRIVLSADIDHRRGGIVEIALGRLAARYRRLVDGHQQAAREELILMRTARMGQDR